jgi:hypothetical protein
MPGLSIGSAGAVAHQAAGDGELTPRKDRGNGATARECRYVVARNKVGEKNDYHQCELDQKGVTVDENCIGPFAHKSCEGRIDLPTGAGVEDLD